MKVQFTAISEQKAEVERRLEPLAAEEAKLRNQEDEFDVRENAHLVGSFCGLLNYRIADFSDRNSLTKWSQSA